MNMEMVDMAKRFIENAPEAEVRNPDLAGFGGEIGFLCARCAARISARGYVLLNTCGATIPVWIGQQHGNCGVCGNP